MGQISLRTMGQILLRANTQRIMRSVYGHLAAARVDGFETGGSLDRLKDWFLSGTGSIPDDICFYYWLYPYKPQIIVRGFGFVPDIRNGMVPISGWLMKFFPIGFLIAVHVDQNHLDVPRLDLHQHLPLNASVDLRLPMKSLKPSHWPEAYPGEHGLVLSGPHAMHSIPRPKN